MKITDVKVVSLRSQGEPVQEGAIPSPLLHRATLVMVETDEDVTGVGVTGLCGYGEKGVAWLIEEGLKPVVIGRDPNLVEKLWMEMWYRHSAILCLPMMGAISAIDIALWDIKGKVHGQPISMLLGGCHERIKAYGSTGILMTPEQHTKAAEVLYRMGFRVMKMKYGRPKFEDDVRAVRAVVEAMEGNEFQVAVDGNQSFSGALADYRPDDVLKKAKEFEKLGCIWLEEPIPSTDVEGLAELAKALGIPIAMGETEYTFQQFRTLLEKSAADIVQPDTLRAGGITAVKKIGVLAEVYNKPLIPHSLGLLIGEASNLQCGASMPNCPMVEYAIEVDQEGRVLGGAESHRPYLKDGAKEWMINRDGYLEVPKKPGLGIEVDVKKILEDLRED